MMNASRYSSNAFSEPAGNEPARGQVARAVGWVVSLLPVLLGMCLAWAGVVSLAVPVRQYLLAGSYSWLSGALLYALAYAGLAGWLLRVGPERERRAIWGLIGGSALLKLLLVLVATDLPLNTDQSIFRHFVEIMADHRLGGDALVSLSGSGDYSIWAGRAMPVHYFVRRLAGGQDALWLRLLNVLVSSATLAMTYAFARRLLPAGKRKWAVFLLVALPFQTFVATDYSHHLFSSFYLLLGVWCGWELVHAGPGALRKLGLALLAGLCLLLMAWQRGIHLIALGTWAGLLVWAGFQRLGWRRWGLLAFWLGIVPLALAMPLAHRYDAWLSRHDSHRLNSMLPAFAARGWCPESDGEYCGRYEQLDRATPWPEKKNAMWRLVFSQIRYNAKAVCVRFPLVKTAKLFLVGYASNIEESLVEMDSRALPWVRGARLAGAPLFLVWAGLGCFVLAAGSRSAQGRWLAVCLVPLSTWGTYVFLGETSPRYSIFFQPFLALLGACAWPEQGGSRGWILPAGAWKSLVWRGGTILAAGVLALAGLAFGIRHVPAQRFYADLRQGWETSGERPAEAIVGPGDYRPFEATIRLPEGSKEIQVGWRLPCRSGSAKRVSLYVLGADSGLRQADLSIGTAAGPLYALPLRELSGSRYVELEAPPAADVLWFRLRSSRPPEERAGGRLQIGYATCAPKPAGEPAGDYSVSKSAGMP